jgi:glycyl-tRNA synthetase beta chain
LFGIETSGATRGHRFHHPGSISVDSPEDYARVLRTVGRVEPSFSRRRDMIAEQVQKLAEKSTGKAMIDAELLDEVTALCEWPTAILGSFDEDFLEVPPEVLIETMQKNQKYFPLFASDRRLLPHFIAISNIESRNLAQVQAGNERVIRPRFADAAFFWHQDLRYPLSQYTSKLEEVVFQEKLGTLAEKSARVSQICRHIAGLLGLDEELAARSAHLAKCDLMTRMIFEFPSLQGLMGRYYAQRSGEDSCVAAAMEEQYLPRHAGDQLPQTDCGRILSIADKVDTLVGIFAIGQRPTGVKDPYALRRAAIGLMRILIETPLALDLRELLEFAAEELRDKVDATSSAHDVFDYAMERLKGYYQDQGIRADTVEAVLAAQCSVPSDCHLRILAVDSFRRLPEAEALTAANKRIRNILRKSDDPTPIQLERESFRSDAERILAEQIAEKKQAIAPMLKSKAYGNVLRALAELRVPVDVFFEQVMVMDEDATVRKNRLALLGAVEALFLQVADISHLQ